MLNLLLLFAHGTIVNHDANVGMRHCFMQVLQEHKRAFEYNIAIVQDFKVGYRRFLLAVQKLIPSWVYLAGILAIVAAWVAFYMSGKAQR